MSTLKLEHIAHIDNAGPDISIDSNGNVGIGTTSPDRSLHVTRADGTGTVIKVGNTGTSSATIEFSDTSTTDTVSIGSVGNDLTLKSDDGDISFNTTSDPATASMYIERGGKVGIGVTDPDSALEVQSASSGNNSLHIANTSSTGYGAKFLGGGNTATRYIADFRNYSGVSKVKIDGDGKVGIGTPTPGDELTVVGQALFSYTDIAANSSAQYAQVEIQKDDADANWSYLAFHETGSIAWQQGILDNKFVIASTGGVAKTSTDAERFTIDTSGNVGIGTTNPTNKLHTDGAMVSTNLAQGTGELQIQGYGSTGYINMNGSGSLIFRMGSSYSQDLKLTSAGILQGSSDAEIKTSPIRKHSNTISTNTTIDSSENAIASGPISVATGVTLTINGNMTVV